MAITVTKDLRSELGPVRDQGARPTCIAFATSDAHSLLRGPYAPLSAEHLYFNAVQTTPSRDPHAGVNTTAIMQALKASGQCAEAGWPYLASLPADLKSWRPPAGATPSYRCHGSLPACNIAEIVALIDADWPVIVMLRLGARFHRPVAGLVEPGPNDVDTAYHAVLAVGHGNDKGQIYVLVRNSWGGAWGDKGHAWVDSNYLAPRLYKIAKMETVL